MLKKVERVKNMVTRIISANASEILKMNGTQLKQSIKASEGRTVLSENVVTEPAIDNLTTSEIAVAFGADLILLNLFDTLNPKVSGLEVDKPENTVKKLQINWTPNWSKFGAS